LSNPHKFQVNRLLTQEEIEIRVWAVVVLLVTFILAGIVMFMLYSLAFVVQPIKSMAPIDQAFAKMLNDIVLLIVGGIGGVMSRKGVQTLAEKMSTQHLHQHRHQPHHQLPLLPGLLHLAHCLHGSTLSWMKSGARHHHPLRRPITSTRPRKK